MVYKNYAMLNHTQKLVEKLNISNNHCRTNTVIFISTGPTVFAPVDSNPFATAGVLVIPCHKIKVYSSCNKQESPAVADKPARRESMPKIAPIRRAYREILRKFKLIEFKVIQGHRSWCQSKAHVLSY